MESKNFLQRLTSRGKLGLPFLLLAFCYAQNSPVLTITPPDKLVAKRGGRVDLKLAASLNAGFHVNSNKPSEEYLIPLKLTWAPGPLEPVSVEYPKPHMQKYSFSPTPLSVLTGSFQVETKFKVSPTASTGPAVLTGKMQYQACNDKACFPPKTIPVKVAIEVQ